MSVIDYSNGTLAKEKAEELLNGESAVNKIKLDSTVILCTGGDDFDSVFSPLYEDTVTKLEGIVSRMGTSLETLKSLDEAMESDVSAGLNYQMRL